MNHFSSSGDCKDNEYLTSSLKAVTKTSSCELWVNCDWLFVPREVENSFRVF